MLAERLTPSPRLRSSTPRKPQGHDHPLTCARFTGGRLGTLIDYRPLATCSTVAAPRSPMRRSPTARR